jgi:hypothetical protein
MSKTVDMIRITGDKVLIPITTGAAGAVVGNQLPQNQRSSKKAREKVKDKVTKNLVPIIKSDDPYFNHEAAQKAANLVMKMDDDTAEVFTYLVMAEMLEEDIEKNRRTLQRHVDEVVAKRIDRIKKAMLTTVAKGESEDSVAYAQALAIFEKAYKNPYTTGAYHFEESDFRRDSRTGRFQTKVRVNPEMKPLHSKQAKNLGIDTGNATSKYNNMTNEQKSQFQQEYMQIANFLNAVSATGDLGDNDVNLRVQDSNGNMYWRKLNGKPKLGEDWDPKAGDRVVGVEARPTGITVGGAAFGLVNSLGHHQMSPNTVRGISSGTEHFDSFATDWSRDDFDHRNSNERTYNRIKSGSKYVTQVAPQGSKAWMAGKLGEQVGQHGKQAERVIGPAARKTAYRYRGTEKKPDADVAREYEIAVGRAEKPTLTPEQRQRLTSRQKRALTNYRKNKAENTKTPVDAVKIAPAEVKQINQNVERMFMEQIESAPVSEEARGAGRERLATYLMDEKVRPDKNLFGLQLESGNTPPSEGFLIDKNGKLVTQAVGYGDDHYLPFNLKHLKSLRGGEYIRSRSVGGPTTEDIYTGLMLGADQITVVSRSGFFTVKFADDFKGKRRYNDKAKRMVRRYETLVDSVQSEQIERPQSISPDIRAHISETVRTKMAALPRSEQRAEIKRMVDDYKNEISSLDEEDFNLYRDDVTERQLVTVAALPEAQKNRVRAQMRNDWQAHNEYYYRLNGWGYRDALKALREQFPYYLTVDYQPTQEMERFEPERDKGYVEPGRNRPTAAQAGLFGTSVNRRGEGARGGKFSASQADYQGQSTTRDQFRQVRDFERARAGKAEAPEGAPAAAPAATEVAPARAEVPTSTRQERIAFEDAGVALVRALQQHVEVGPNAKQLFGALNMENEADIREFFNNTTKVRDAEEVLTTLPLDGPNIPEPVRKAVRDYRAASGRINRAKYDPKLALTRDKPPFLFPEKAYGPNATPEDINQESDRLDQVAHPVSDAGVRFSEMDENDLNTEIDILYRLQRAKDEIAGMTGMDKIRALQEYRIDTTIPGVAEVLENEKLTKQAEIAQRRRALNLAASRVQPGTPTGTLQLETQRQTLAPRDPEQVRKMKEQANTYIKAFEDAAARLESFKGDRTKETAANALRLRAAGWKDLTQQAEVDEERFGVYSSESMNDVMFASAILQNLATEDQIENFVRDYES